MHENEALLSLVGTPEALPVPGVAMEALGNNLGALLRLGRGARQLIFIELVRVVPAQRGYFRPLAHEAVSYDRRGPAEVVQRGCRL